MTVHSAILGSTIVGSATMSHLDHDRVAAADLVKVQKLVRRGGGPMIELFSYPFMQRALLAALLTGLIAPAIGTYIVQRRLSLLGDGLGHVAIAGVGLALLTGAAPMPVAVVVCVAGAVWSSCCASAARPPATSGLPSCSTAAWPPGCCCPASPARGRRAGAVPVRLAHHGRRTRSHVVAVLAVVILVPTIGLAPQLFAVSDRRGVRPHPGTAGGRYNMLSSCSPRSRSRSRCARSGCCWSAR